MIKDLTTLKWKKNIYYISDDIIFEIANKRKKEDLDECSTYLIDMENAPEKVKKAADGTQHAINEYPEIFINNVPYLLLIFESRVGEQLKYYFPLQYLVEEGDRILDGKTIQAHPDIYANSYVNKFNYEIFNFIKKSVKNKNMMNSTKTILSILPDWLTCSTGVVSKFYIEKYFIKGTRANIKEKDGDELYHFVGTFLGLGGVLSQVNIWNDSTIQALVVALNAEKVVNAYKAELPTLSVNSMEDIAASMKDFTLRDSAAYPINTFLNIENGEVKFESLSVSPDVDTYYEYADKKKDQGKKYFKVISDEESWNNAGKGLQDYYIWSDQANAPYKEDLWNTVAERAANINDAKKNAETGEYELDEYGNYIYENCERCWKGAVNAPGAKYPWIVVNITDDVESTITFKYTYPDGTVKTVNPWGDRVFSYKEGVPCRTWGVASVAGEFEDNDFLISANRTDGGNSTFDINRFEMILNPV